MANKPKNSNNKKENSELRKSISNNVERGLSGAEGKLALKSASFASRKGVEEGDLFRFDDFPESKAEVDKMFSDFLSDVDGFIKAQQKKVFSKANARLDKLETNISKFYNGRKHIPTQFASNEDALRAFQKRIDPNGLNISKRLWRLEPEYRKKVEDAITAGLQKGQGPIALANRVTKYLREFEGDKPLPKAARSKKNCHYAAYRLAYTEINMAYRTAEQERYKQMEDVVGMRIKTSEKSHKEADLCDVLAGDYPKTFKWTGWHPLCHCYSVPIFRTKREHDGGEEGADAVKRVPANYTKWVENNATNIAAASQRRKLPYFLADNKETWQRMVKEKRETEVLRRVLRGENAEISTRVVKKKGIGEIRGSSSLSSRKSEEQALMCLNDKEYKSRYEKAQLTEEQADNLLLLQKSVGVKGTYDLKPMTFMEADSGRANDMKASDVCVNSVFAFEARRRGLNVTAATNMDEVLSENFYAALRTTKGKTPQYSIIKCEAKRGKDLETSVADELDVLTSKLGRRYSVAFNYKKLQNGEQDGHAFFAERTPKGLVLYDPSNNSFPSLALILEKMEKADGLEVLRIDNLFFNVEESTKLLRPSL